MTTLKFQIQIDMKQQEKTNMVGGAEWLFGLMEKKTEDYKT